MRVLLENNDLFGCVAAEASQKKKLLFAIMRFIYNHPP